MAKQIPSGLPKTEAASPHMVPAAYVQSQPGYQRPGDAAQMPWMPVPPAHLNCPPGLEYLTLIDTILIHQQVEPLELLTGFETANKYEIRNRLGERIYFAVEYNDCCTRNCCGYSRPFTMKIMDNMRREVIILERPLRCNSCFCPCCLQKIEIQAPPGVPIGYISQKWHPYLPKFTIQNEQKEDVMKIIGPCLMCSCCGNVDFEIRSLDETTVLGRISKHWSGILKEVFTDTDDFGVYFALDLDVKMKAVMIGACLLIGIYLIQAMEFFDLQPTLQWMFVPKKIPNCPPGLEYLAQINQLIVCQRFDLQDVIGNLETSKAYEVMNNQGERIYFAEEKSNFFLQNLCGSSRPFTMTIYDNVGRDVITIRKALRCHCCCINCSLQKLKVEAPPGETIGYVYQNFHPFLPTFKLKNENKEDVMKIRGPCVISSCIRDLNFNLLSLDEELVLGNVSKHCPGFVTGLLTDVDKFGIQFPFDLDVKIKALMLGASFLIDYMYFELWS